MPISPAGATLLAAVDDRVDKALVSTQKVVSDNAAFLTQQIQKQKEFHAQNLEAYKTARDNYLKKVRPGAAGGGRPVNGGLEGATVPRGALKRPAVERRLACVSGGGSIPHVTCLVSPSDFVYACALRFTSPMPRALDSTLLPPAAPPAAPDAPCRPQVEDAVEDVKQHGLSESAHKAANEVLARVGEAQAAVLATPGLLLGRVVAAVEALLAFGPVHSAVEAVKPSLGAVSVCSGSEVNQGRQAGGQAGWQWWWWWWLGGEAAAECCVLPSACGVRPSVVDAARLASLLLLPAACVRAACRPRGSTCACTTPWWPPPSTSRRTRWRGGWRSARRAPGCTPRSRRTCSRWRSPRTTQVGGRRPEGGRGSCCSGVLSTVRAGSAPRPLLQSWPAPTTPAWCSTCSPWQAPLRLADWLAGWPVASCVGRRAPLCTAPSSSSFLDARPRPGPPAFFFASGLS